MIQKSFTRFILFAVLLQLSSLLWSTEPIRLRMPEGGMNPSEVTKLVRNAFDLASKTGRSIIVESGTYPLEDTINLGSILEITGEGYPKFIMTNAEKDILHSGGIWRTRIHGIAFEGGRDQVVLGNQNTDRGHYVISNCRFIKAAGVGIRILPNTCSTQVIVEKCTFDFCTQVLVTVSDFCHFSDSWIQTAMENPKNLPVIENWNHLTLEHIVGVPLVVNNNLRWINNYGRLSCRDVRFGGEDGGFTPVVNYAKCKSNVFGPQILLENCTISAQGNRQRKCAVYCEEIPNGIILRDCSLLGVPPLRVSPEINFKTCFRNIMPGMLRFDFKNNMGEFANDIPEGFNEAVEAASHNTFTFLPGEQLSEAETSAALTDVFQRLRDYPPFKDGYSANGRKQQIAPGTNRSITTETHVWKLDDCLDGTTEPCAGQLAFRGCGESVILLNRVKNLTYPHIRIQNVEVDLDHFPFLTWRLRNSRFPGGHIAVKIIDHASQQETLLSEDYSDGQFRYRAFDLRKTLQRKTGKAIIDIKLYLIGGRVNQSIPPYPHLQKGEFFILDFLRMEQP